MAEHRLREIYPIFCEELDYLIDLLVDGEIDADELRWQARSVGLSNHDIDRALAFAGAIP